MPALLLTQSSHHSPRRWQQERRGGGGTGKDTYSRFARLSREAVDHVCPPRSDTHSIVLCCTLKHALVLLVVFPFVPRRKFVVGMDGRRHPPPPPRVPLVSLFSEFLPYRFRRSRRTNGYASPLGWTSVLKEATGGERGGYPARYPMRMPQPATVCMASNTDATLYAAQNKKVDTTKGAHTLLSPSCLDINHTPTSARLVLVHNKNLPLFFETNKIDTTLTHLRTTMTKSFLVARTTPPPKKLCTYQIIFSNDLAQEKQQGLSLNPTPYILYHSPAKPVTGGIQGYWQ